MFDCDINRAQWRIGGLDLNQLHTKYLGILNNNLEHFQ